ncbi:MAG TPA: glutamine-hydrolyzing GMP synthase [Candidatus Peregrinibacteria bacterium]|nr:glutamine-hydrolyzing GMP synthase [Candidatus Peregrinibacteria bacterium]
MNKIAVLDFGGQYCHLIANRIRRLGVFSEIHENEVAPEKLKEYKGIILSGGPQNLSESTSLKVDPKIYSLKIPILGICYGHQLMNHQLGGKVKAGKTKEYGLAELNIKKDRGIFTGLGTKRTPVWMSHGDEVANLPEGFEAIGSTVNCLNTAVADFGRDFYGVQFHPEVTHTEEGMQMLRNFLEICQCKREWSLENFKDEKIKEIREQIGNKKVFLLASGGVDSTVAFVLINEALGNDNVYGLFVDTGFMRHKEGEEVKIALRSLGFQNLHTYDASEEFFTALQGIDDPEEKRVIIGNKFIEVQEKALKNLDLDPEEWILAQGTIYPDTIETGGTKHANKIKTHHNRVEKILQLIETGKVIEPLKELYKDEVREVGELLGIKHDLVWRHPFPGPGLAVRCLCSSGEEKVEEKEKWEKEINSIIDNSEIKTEILSIKSVGVQGDSRTYRHPLLLSASLDYDQLGEISTLITNKISVINRTLWLVYAKGELSSVTEAHIKKAFLIPERIKLLQKVDAIVDNELRKHGIYEDIWQFPVVLVPFGKNGETIILRPIESTEAMTANFYPIERNILKSIIDKISKIPEIDFVMYDLTNKPPGTIEWE